MSRVESVHFEKDYWTTTSARQWLKNHKLKPIKRVDKTGRYLRYRVREPKRFSRIRTIKTGKHLNLLIGFV